jgi:hypothetical protein
VQAEVGSIFVVVANIIREQPLQMPLVQHDDMIEQIAPATLDPSLRDTILPWTFERGPHSPDAQGSHCRKNFCSIPAIAVEDQKPGSRFKRKRFPQLLSDPLARRMLGDIEVENLATIVADHEETVEHAEPESRNREEVHRRKGFPMIAKKSKPAFGWPGVPRRSFHPTGNRPLGNIET